MNPISTRFCEFACRGTVCGEIWYGRFGVGDADAVLDDAELAVPSGDAAGVVAVGSPVSLPSVIRLLGKNCVGFALVVRVGVVEPTGAPEGAADVGGSAGAELGAAADRVGAAEPVAAESGDWALGADGVAALPEFSDEGVGAGVSVAEDAGSLENANGSLEGVDVKPGFCSVLGAGSSLVGSGFEGLGSSLDGVAGIGSGVLTGVLVSGSVG